MSPDRRILVELPPSEPTPRGVMLSAMERWSKVLSIAAIPVVLALTGQLVERAISRQEVGRDYVKMALDILAQPDSDFRLRQWAVEVLEAHSPVGFGDSYGDLRGDLESGAIRLPAATRTQVMTNVPASGVENVLRLMQAEPEFLRAETVPEPDGEFTIIGLYR